MTENIGIARADLTIDTRDYELSLERAKSKTIGFSDAAEESYRKLEGRQKTASDNLIRYVQSLERSTDQRRLLTAAENDVPAELWREAAQRIQTYNTAVMLAEQETRRLAEATERAAANERWLAGLQRQGQVLGMTRADLLEFEAAERGLTAQAAPLIAAFRAKEAAIRAESGALQQGKKWNDQYNMSQKQVEFALRGLPAQITDIFVSLQGGQAPLTVLLQQGGQLKDMFGGIGNAARVMGGELVKLATNPIVLAVGAVGTLTYAWIDATRESQAFTRALEQNNNILGVTSFRLAQVAQEAAVIGNFAYGDAAEAAAATAANGNILAEMLDSVTRAALNLNKVTGAEFSDTVAKFAEIGKSPVEGALKLNESLHFLTVELYDQIKALEEQGRAQEAAALATRAAEQATTQSLQAVRAELNWAQQGWDAVRGAASAAWREMKIGIGLAGQADELAALRDAQRRDQALVAQNAANGFVFPENSDIRRQMEVRAKQIANIERDIAVRENQARIQAGEQRAQELAIANERLMEAQLPKAEKMAAEIQRAHSRISQAVTDANMAENTVLAQRLIQQYDAVEKAIRAKYETKKSGGPKSSSLSDVQRAELNTFKNALDAEESALENQTKALKAQYDLRAITAENYYAQLSGLAQKEALANENAIQGQIAYLETQKQTVAVKSKIAELEADLVVARLEAEGNLSAIDAERAKNDKQRADSLADYARALQATESAMMRQNQAQLQVMGLGSREAEMVARVTELYFRQADALQQLEDQKRRDGQDDEWLRERETLLRESTARQVQIVRDGYAQMTVARADWRSAWNSSVAELTDEAFNVAGQTNTVFNTITSGFSDSFKALRRESKLTFDSIGESLADLAIEFGTNKILAWLMGMFSPTGSSGMGGAGIMSGFPITGYAKGAVKDGSALRGYSNGVFDSPQVFAFAKGNVGVFGEAGEEAIMPLSRDSSGRLGVSAQGAGRSSSGGIVLNIYGAQGEPEVNVTESSDGTLTIDAIFDQAMAREAGKIASGTSQISRALKSRYVLQER